MPKHPWNNGLSIYAATQRKASSTPTYRADRDSGVDNVIKSVYKPAHRKFVGMQPCEFDIVSL